MKTPAEATLEVWRPAGGAPAVLVRWFMTEWCNYRCPYCPQTHGRYAAKGDQMTAHAFDNFPVEAWIGAFDRHFAQSRLSLVLTGGEPMVDRRNMTILLKAFHVNPRVEAIRIDTNAWWRAEQVQDLPRSKISLMCTFHPSETDEEFFLERLSQYKANGFRIGLVNYVMDRSNLERFRDRRKRFAELGFVLHPNPLWSPGQPYSQDDLELMREVLPDLDFRFRTQTERPTHKPCLFPSLAYELDYKGNIIVGCHSRLSGSFFDSALPALPPSAVPCPHASCVCLDKYSFLVAEARNTTTNPLQIYSDLLAAKC